MGMRRRSAFRIYGVAVIVSGLIVAYRAAAVPAGSRWDKPTLALLGATWLVALVAHILARRRGELDDADEAAD